MVCRRVVDAVLGEVAGKATQPFLEYGHVDAPDELVPVVDVKHENPGVGAPFFLGAVRHAQVEVPLDLSGVGPDQARSSEGEC